MVPETRLGKLAEHSRHLSGQVRERQDSYVMWIAYSFLVADDRYGGHYEREFSTEKEATQALQRLLASPPMVRYKPGQPDRKILDPEEISSRVRTSVWT